MESKPFNHHFKNNKTEAPPIIGFFITDKAGKTLITIEAFKNSMEQGIIKPEHKGHFDLDLIPMFASAFENFSADINFKQLEVLSLEGSGLRMEIFYGFGDFTLVFFSRPEIKLASFKEEVERFFNWVFSQNKFLKEACAKPTSIMYMKRLVSGLQRWLERLNSKISSQKKYLQRSSHFESIHYL